MGKTLLRVRFISVFLWLIFFLVFQGFSFGRKWDNNVMSECLYPSCGNISRDTTSTLVASYLAALVVRHYHLSDVHWAQLTWSPRIVTGTFCRCHHKTTSRPPSLSISTLLESPHKFSLWRHISSTVPSFEKTTQHNTSPHDRRLRYHHHLILLHLRRSDQPLSTTTTHKYNQLYVTYFINSKYWSPLPSLQDLLERCW